MKRIAFLFVALLLMGAASGASEVQLNFFRVDVQESDFVITWEARVEKGVRTYELHRKTSYSNEFALVEKIAARGRAVTYRYVDSEVYKAAAEQVDYQLEVVHTDGTREMKAQQQVNYTPTAVRRTWGSIKAMFQ